MGTEQRRAPPGGRNSGPDLPTATREGPGVEQAHQPEACEYWENWDGLGNLTRNSHFLNPGLEPCP